MNEQFKLLGLDEVVTVENYYQIVISHSTFRVDEFTEALIQDLKSFVTADFEGKQKERLQKGWFEEGTACERLSIGAKEWQKGKIRIRVSVEFCPDESDIIEVPTNNLEILQEESPLDDIRQMINQNIY